MKHLVLVVLVLALINLASCRTKVDPHILESLSLLDKLKIQSKHPNDMTVPCALCGVATNEIFGFLSENITLTEIETRVKGFCSKFGGEVTAICDTLLVPAVPYIVGSITNPSSIDIICVDLGLCTQPFPDGHPDLVPPPKFTIDLDLPPINRWTKICSVPDYKAAIQFILNTILYILPTDAGNDLKVIGQEINDNYYPPDYADEIKGCALAAGIDYGYLALVQLAYELSDGCTSIVAQADDGTVYHARNLDFGIGMAFTGTLKNLTMQVDFVKNNKVLFTASTFASYIGVLSGMKPNGFSVTIDTRYYPEGIGQMFYEIIAAIEENNASLVSFLSRRVLENENNWQAAVNNLSKGTLIADVYYIIAGVGPGEGTVISRNRTSADVWTIDSPQRWFEVETNYDHWNQPPWYDNRRDPAILHMNNMGQKNITIPNLYDVLSQKPTLNLQTTYSIVAHPATSTYSTFVRYCRYPCVQ